MICQHCNKQNESPLHSYKGEWICPSCYKSLFPTEETQFVITMENHTKFKKAERLYNQNWLLRETKKGSFTAAQASFNEAIALTEETAQQNPFALISLGYYYEVERRELQLNVRYYCAFLAYKAVLLNNEPIKMGLEGDKTIGEGPTATLKNTAARNMAGLFKQLDLLNMHYLINDEDRTAVEAKLIEYSINISDENSKSTFSETNAANAIKTIWNESGAPSTALFGLYSFSKDEASSFLAGVSKSYSLNLYGAIIGVDDSKINKFDEIENHNTLKKTVESVGKITENDNTENDNKEKRLLVFFINGRAKKGAKLSKGIHKKVQKIIAGNLEYIAEGMLANNLENNYTFYEDDILINCHSDLNEKGIKAMFYKIFGITIK